MTKKNKNDYIIKSVEKALNILENFKHKKEMGVTELSNRLNIPKSSLYHLLTTLEVKGYLKQNPENGRYKLGLKLFELGSIVMDQMEVRSKAQPILEELSNLTKETVHLVVFDEGEVVYIDKKEGSESIQINSKIGRSLPAYCTGVGKALLANIKERRLEKYLSQTELKKFTENTITNRDRLKKELKNIRKQGYATDKEEYNYGLYCIAVPVKNYTGNAIAALSISGPKDRLEKKGKKRLVKILMNSGKKLSRNLGYNKDIKL